MLKKSTIGALIAAGSLLSGCIGNEVPYESHRGYRDDRAYDHDRAGTPDRVQRDRDGDGVRDRQDRRPEDPRRY